MSTIGRRDFLSGSLAAGSAAVVSGCMSSKPELPPIPVSGKIPRRLFWSWDHSTNWSMNVPGEQNCGVGNEYTKKPGMFELDYRRVVDWCADHGMHGVGIVGLLRDRHGGVDAARRLCAYAQEKGVRIYLIAGLFAYGGIYYEGDSEWSLNKKLRENPAWIGKKQDGSPLIYRHMGSGGSKVEPMGCASNPGLYRYVLDSIDWLFKTIPELGGIQMEAGDNGVCQCDRCRARRGGRTEKNPMSIEDMALIYPPAGDVIRSRNKDAWVICECYHHFLDDPCVKTFRADSSDENVQKLLSMPSSTIFQWGTSDFYKDPGKWNESSRMLPAMRRFHNILRTHAGTQWSDGRYFFAAERIRRECRLSYLSGADYFSMFGENNPFYANSEFNYLAMTYFSDHPLAEMQHFVRDEMGPRLGGWELAERWCDVCNIQLDATRIPAAVDGISKIISGLSRDREARRRWLQLASWLESYRYEAKFWPDPKGHHYYFHSFNWRKI